MRRMSLVLGLLVCGGASLARAQLPVEEIGWNLAFNGTQAVEAVFQTEQWILDMAPLEAWGVVEGRGGCLEQSLAGLVMEAQIIGMEIDNIQAQLDSLFGLESAPTTSFAFRERVAEIHQQLWLVYGYSMRMQTLIDSIVRTVEHILGFVEQVAALVGKLSVEQTLSQQLAKLHQLQAEGNAARAAYQFAQSTQALAPGVLQRGLRNIIEEMMSDHPSW